MLDDLVSTGVKYDSALSEANHRGGGAHHDAMVEDESDQGAANIDHAIEDDVDEVKTETETENIADEPDDIEDEESSNEVNEEESGKEDIEDEEGDTNNVQVIENRSDEFPPPGSKVTIVRSGRVSKPYDFAKKFTETA